jgi:DNA-binding NtrC family response regulator
MQKEKIKILVVDDDAEIRSFLSAKLQIQGYEVITVVGGIDAIEACKQYDLNMILLDYDMPKMNGMQVIHKLKDLGITVPIIMLTAHDSMEKAIEAISLGAKDFITKPFEVGELFSVIEEYSTTSSGRAEQLNREKEVETPKYRMIGSSSKMMKVYKSIGHVSQSENQVNVLVTGESGVGKELVSRQIHIWGKNRNHPFVGINLNAMPDTLIESELFGHEEGAFTNASKSKMGKLEYASAGTLLLDEIGDISMDIQVKLLRVLQEREYYPMGCNKEKKVSARIVASTNADLIQKVHNKEFRQDLYYRLRTIWIHVPSLRERISDVPILTDFFIKKYSTKDSNEVPVKISEKAMEYLKSYNWPGNVRELENVIRSVITTQKKQILEVEDFDSLERGEVVEIDNFQHIPLQEARQIQSDNFEKNYIINLLKQHNGKVAIASEKAGINRQSLYKLMRKHNIES